MILLTKGKITEELVNMMMSWRHSGFNLFCGKKSLPHNEEAMEKLARYIIRASFSQERMSYSPEEYKVAYQPKEGKQEKVFNALG
ncbi:MAG TPA: transposase [Desulfatiglandales bacterium]|nr:transposase [Desulfatiglandales bacterium]